MFKYYSLEILPIIFNRFKVGNIVLDGILDNETMNQVLKYCESNDFSYTNISPQNDLNFDMLLELSNYDAIFLNYDPNWYTVYNELKIIKKQNDLFPLVFICHNVFPHKRRDSYINPDFIPEEFRKEYSKNFEYEDILLTDDFYHAIEQNTPKNGVLTAIEDFLSENSSIGIMDIKFLNGITILYPKNSISHIRLNKLAEEIVEFQFNEDLSDNIIEKQLVLNQFSQLNISKNDLDIIDDLEDKCIQKEKIIGEYENKIKLHDEEINYKDSQISNIDSKLSLKDAKIRNLESRVFNNETEINSLKNKLQNANKQIDSLKTNISHKESEVGNLNNQLQNANNQIKLNEEQLNNKNNQLRIKQKELQDKKNRLDSVEFQYNKQLSKLDSKEYCISCYKEEIHNNHLEIDYLSKDTITKKIFSPISYLYLLFKSHPKELSLNFKLYRALKNSKCFDIGYYLNKNEDLIDSQWCKYFSPELHYVCNGFNEKRKFNKKYFNTHSKKELLEYIINCRYI